MNKRDSSVSFQTIWRLQFVIDCLLLGGKIEMHHLFKMAVAAVLLF
jgi:hypothetical protein